VRFSQHCWHLCGCLSLLEGLLEHLCCRLAPPARSASLLRCACLCFMLLFALVCPVVGWCCRSRLLLCSGCFAAIAPLGLMLRCHVARVVALPPVSPRSQFSGRCLAAVSVMAPHPWMLCRVHGRRLWQMLCRHGLFSSGCFAAIVVLVPLADALPSRLIATSPGRSLPPTLLEACSVDSAVSLHY
jgi:hypothetical protein